jgi:hypothetical protein
MSTKTAEQSREYNARYRAKIKARAAQDGITQAQARVILSAEFQAAEAARLAAKPVKPTKPRLTEEERKQARREASARINAKRKAEREGLGLTVAQHTAYKAGKPLDTIRAEAVQKATEKVARAARARQPKMPNTTRYTEAERLERNREASRRTHARDLAEREELGLTATQYQQYRKGKPVDQIVAEAEVKAQLGTAVATDEDDNLLNPQAQQLLIEIMHERFAPNVIARAHTREPRAQAVLKLAQALIEQGKQEDSGDLHRAGVALAFYRSPEEKRTRWQPDDE